MERDEIETSTSEWKGGLTQKERFFQNACPVGSADIGSSRHPLSPPVQLRTDVRRGYGLPGFQAR